MKKISFFTLIFFLVFVHNTWAHTGIESSFPEDGAVIKEDLKAITLTFETKIEQGSTFALQNSAGESVPVETISLSEKQIVGNPTDPLENGDYKVNWNIIGADGHPIDGVISFSVLVPAVETPVEEAETKEQVDTDEVEPQSDVEESNSETQQNNSTSYVIPALIGILLVIIIVSFIWIMKRKK